eukprot:TRINITY_DN12847_c0_g1_i1.p1 TRINITY_DN12847_c0_g1~~TRINITY_DN12847_c0_g1_i1.p1  ORF type:complete len:114 (+),score=6.68 TRINITY_DN12847_c0_g1_i1:359-700(+)
MEIEGEKSCASFLAVGTIINHHHYQSSSSLLASFVRRHHHRHQHHHYQHLFIPNSSYLYGDGTSLHCSRHSYVEVSVFSYLLEVSDKFYVCPGVCAMCGKQVIDTKLYKQSNV